IRAGLLALVLERVAAGPLRAAMTGVSTDRGAGGLRAYLADLDLPTFRAILAAERPDIDDRDPAILTETISLAILTRRIRANHPARLVRGRLRSLMDHPVSETA